MKKRILSALMALALCLTLLPAAALAAEPHTSHCICGETTHIGIGPHDSVNFTQALTTREGTNELFADGKAVEPTGSVYTLLAGNYYLAQDIVLDNPICVESGEVNLCLNGYKITLYDKRDAVFTIKNGATLNLTDCSENGTATIGHNTNTQENGSGVKVESGGTFNMYGGKITGNKANSTAGGVCVTGTNSKFNMYGGKITGNTATQQGGGVYVVSGGTFNLYDGGTISGNTANSTGGGVYVRDNKSTFNMYGGTISGNTAESTGKNKVGTGGGVSVSKDGTFIMSGGTISRNTTDSTDGGVCVAGGQFTMSGGKITGNTASYFSGGVGVHNSATFIMSGGTIGGTTDGEANKANQGGGVNVDEYGKFEMSGGEISGNKATQNGGGVYVDDGTFTMSGSASIKNNKTETKSYGGGVYMNGGTFTMNGSASITDNTANQGGGVHVSDGNFIMSGGSITDNDGSGVYVGYTTTTFTVSGAATVKENRRDKVDSNVFLTGSAIITIGGALDEGASIGVDTNLVPMKNKPVVVAEGSKKADSSYTVQESDAEAFFSDHRTYQHIEFLGGSVKLCSGAAHTHSWSYEKEDNDPSTIYVSCTGKGDCEYKTDPATVTISMTQSPYTYSENMDAPTAQLTYSDNWPEGPDGVKKAQESQIEFYKSVDDGISYTGPVTNINELKKPGKYVAQLYFNGKYLEAYFSVVDNSKQNPTYTPPTAKNDLVYTGENQPLIDPGSTNHGRMWYKLGTDDVYLTLVPMAKDAGSYTVYYKVEGDATHNDVPEKSIQVRIERAQLSGTPTFKKVTEAGKTLEDVTFTKADGWPDGEFKWDNGAAGYDMNAPLVQGEAYSWLYLADNYYAKGTVVLWANPSSGSSSGTTGGTTGSGSSSGGGSGSYDSNPVVKTETKTHPDGSTTKTETRKDGSVTQTTTGKDGSVSKTETKKDGSSVTENKAADGSTGTVKTDKNGQTEANAKVSAKAVEDAKKSGEAVKAPVEVKASRNSNTAPTVKVELPGNAGKTEVEIPVSNATAGTVAVLVHPDGTEEILKDSIPTENGIQLTINGGATVKIVDNSKDFIDTRNHWAREEIDFVSARELVNGMSDTIYAPNASATRAQLWTILARQNDADLNGGNTWYEKAQLWSKDKGISDGTEPNAAINRAQMVTMLWRTMGQPAATDKVSFADVPAGSYYAQAVAWAVESGITQGVGGGKFDPTATCTRAQIAAFLARSMK